MTSINMPSAAEVAAIAQTQADGEIRALAQELRRSVSLGFTPGTKIKGVITEIAVSGSPPTVTVQIGGDASTEISNVRMLDNFSPVIGESVIIEKQGAQVLIVGQVSSGSALSDTLTSAGWIVADLSNGSHDGNTNGDVCYRRILDNGSWKVQWRGGWAPGGATTMMSAGTIPVDYRPTGKRSVLAARQYQTGSVAVQFDFGSDGSATLQGGTFSNASAAVSGDVQYLSGSTGLNSGGIDNLHSHDMSHDHYLSLGSHSHTASLPTWVSLHQVEYFL